MKSLSLPGWQVGIALSVLLLLTLFFSLGVGPAPPQGPAEVWHALSASDDSRDSFPESAARLILWQLRAPRLCLALLVGASLAVAGALMQSLFQNPLADPYLIGVSPGAALGAVLASALGWAMGGLAFGALIGALTATAMVCLLARGSLRSSTLNLLLSGLALGAVLQAATTYLLLRSDTYQLRSTLAWLMGGLAYRGWPYVTLLLPVTIAGIGVSLLCHRAIDALAFGDETAHHLGISVLRIKVILLITATLLTAASVAASGLIGFVGLMVPHFVRVFVTPSARAVLPCSALAGGLLLLWADLAARTALPGEEIPIGLVTSLLGGLFFLALLRARQRA